MACRILAPQPEMESMPPQWKRNAPTTGLPGKSLTSTFLKYHVQFHRILLYMKNSTQQNTYINIILIQPVDDLECLSL